MPFKLSPSPPKNKGTLLTKSRFVSGLQCPKWLWLSFNAPERLPKTDEATQHRFDEGHKVGELAKSLFPDGIEIKETDTVKNHETTKKLLKERKPLFEAGFKHKDGTCYARADILVPVGKNEWDIVEVKSASSVKEDYIWDVAFQRHCYESVGLAIRNCFIMHVNSEYVRQGTVNAAEFFVKADINDEVNDILSEVPKKKKELFKIIALKECPEFKKGEEYHEDESGVHDDDQFWKDHPECDIFDLYYGGKKAIDLFNAGILSIRDVEEHHFTKKQQKIQHRVAKTGEHHYDTEELRAFIETLQYPLYFMDFETYATAIPLYDRVKPYQALPFQFSVHVIEKKGAKSKHHSFIASGTNDPRPTFAKKLRAALGTKGTILAYYQSFEKSRLKELAEFFPEHAPWVEQVTERMVDLYDPFKNFSYYHPLQKGSASLKNVLPALTGKDHYGELDIGNGTDASLVYLHITHGSHNGKKPTAAEIKAVRAGLEKYCGLDTEGMIWILDKLRGLI